MDDFRFLPSLHIKYFDSAALIELFEDDDIDIWKDGKKPEILYMSNIF